MKDVTTIRKFPIPEGQSLLVQLGAMQAYPDKKITMDTGIQTSWYNAVVRKMLRGDNLLLNKFSAEKNQAGWIAFEEATPGQLVEHRIHPGEPILIRKGSFVACDENIEVSATLTGLHGYLSSVGFLVLHAQTSNNNPGRIFFKSGQGVVRKIDITERDEPIIIDNNDILAYTGNLSLSTTAPGGVFSWFYGEEGIVTRFTGKGTVYLGAPQKKNEEVLEKVEQGILQMEKIKQQIEQLIKELPKPKESK